MIRQYHLNDGLCATPTELITITNTEDGLIKVEIKEEPQPTRGRGVMTTLESGGEQVTESGAQMDMEDMDSDEFINEKDIKVELLEEPLNVKGQELTGVDIKLEPFEEMLDIAVEGLGDTEKIKQEQLEVVQHNEIEGAAPSNNYKQMQDTTTLTTQEQNIQRIRKRIAVQEEEISSTSTGTYILWNAANAANKRPVFKNILTYVDIVINKDNSSVNSDNDWTSTETDVDNSGREHTKKVLISDECGDMLDDKCLLEERHNVTRTSNRMSGEGSSHRRTLLQKQRCGRTGIVNEQTDSSRRNNVFQCDVCQRQFTSKGDFYCHINTHIGEKSFECNICQMKFKQKSDLTAHFRTHTGEKPFKCKICDSKFNRSGKLKLHLRIHTGENPFQCNICKRKFKRKDHLKRHLRTHTGEKPFECDICKTKFREKSTLKIHLRSHTGENPFECNICKSKFSHNNYLKIHLRTHTGEKPFECNICRAKFTNKSSLNRHLRTHTGEKPFECDTCQMKFNQISHLKTHFRTHTGEKPFECEICKSKFNRNDHLKRHLRTHTDEKPFECEICKVKFSHKSKLETHLRTHSDE